MGKESDTIYVGGLHFDTTADSLRDYFRVYGEVVNSLVSE